MRVIRNVTGIRPPLFLYVYEKQYLASDLFIWRTDNGFKTIFKATNILEKFYGVDSSLRCIFYDNSGVLLKEIEIDFSHGSLSLLIDEELLGMTGYGTFCVFNWPKKKTSKHLNITNKCYVGYGLNDSFSMFHGNIVSLMVHPDTPITEIEGSLAPAVSSRKGTHKYIIQKRFDPAAENTLCFSNPLKRDINIHVNGVKETINPRGCTLLRVVNYPMNELIEIESDFIFPRPIIVSQRGDYLDCHHA